MRNSLQFLLFSALLHVTFSRLHEFVYVSKSMPWENAQNYCRQHYTDLATVDDQEDHDQLLKTVGMGPVSVWLGLIRTTYPGPFAWSDQSNSTFTQWAPTDPNGEISCAVVSGGVWFDRSCTNSYPFACYSDRKRQIVKLEVKSSQNLNDLEVILAKMEQILKEKGVSGEAKLSWRTQSDGNVFQKKDQKSDATKQTCVSQFYRK